MDPSPIALTPPRVPWKQWLFHRVGAWRSRLLLRRFEARARRARALNLETLRQIVAANQDTAFGRAHGFAGLDLRRDARAFREAVPVQSYEDLRPYVDRMAAGEAGVLCAEPVLFFAMSSGTSGQAKLVPTTRSLGRTQEAFYGGLLPGAASLLFPGGLDPHRGVLLLSGAPSGRSAPCGLPIDSASTRGVGRVQPIVPLLWTSPWPAFTVADHEACWYLHALFGLRESTTKFLNCTFCPTLVHWLRGIAADWPRLVEDIRRGTLSEALRLSPAERQALAPHLVADPARAAQLEAAMAGGVEGFVPRVWPWMRYVATVITGSFAAYVPALRRYLGPDIPIYSTVYVASEAVMGLNLWPDSPERFALAAGYAAFEFIPEARMEEERPDTLDLHELVIGQRYEVVLTNFGGFHRYRLRDVVQVEDFYGESPVISFCYRRGGLLDLVGERISEEDAYAAVRSFVARLPGASLVDYTTARGTDSSPPRHLFYLELEGAPPVDPAWASEALHAAMLEHCHSYRDYAVVGGAVGKPELRLLRPGAFEALLQRRLAASPGSSRNQLKTPRVFHDAEWIGVLEGRC